MYILIDKNTNKVVHTSNKKPISYSNNLILAEVDSLPEKYDYLIAENIREETKIWSEVVEEYDENNELITKEVEKSRTYLTCDLVASFRQINEKIVAKQRAIKEIKELKQKLSDTDYQAIKYAEGWLTEEDYLPIKIQRQEWRNRINELENL